MPDPTSFTARRPAASNLPGFTLPPPPDLPGRFPAYPSTTIPQPTPPSNVLTPPSNLPGDILSPISSGVNSGSSGASNASIPPYTPNGYWPPLGQSGSPFGFSGSSGPQLNFANQNANFPTKTMFSPSFTTLGRNISNSPTAGQGSLPPPPYELNLPSFPTALSISASSGPLSTSLPNLAAQQQAMANAMMGSPNNVSSTNPQASAAPASESYQIQKPGTPNFYGSSHPASAPSHQTSFPASFAAQSSSQQSPHSAAPNLSRISPISANPGHPPALHPAPAPPGGLFGRPMNYALPAMAGPIMSNMHNPGGQMSLVGGLPNGMVSGYPSHNGVSHMYSASGHAQPPQQNDRPFRCDQCPQSFNRNHDLKRHKRIHLAVKPFPCEFCEKSFSRKDALKRHILVKGCGTRKSTDAVDGKSDGSSSPADKFETLSSDDADESPVRPLGPEMKLGT
ncbi:MAG: hypothetical protein M1825_002543 [Sarcosagium campestre]|nr:MAG: hypothetical protein M1825_002543 [Sarcosagium campestre]